MATLHVELVAADRKVWEGEAHSVSARGIEGELGILPGHAPLMTVLADGDVRVKGVEGPQHVHIDSGFLSVDENIVRIVAETVSEPIQG
ncbi:ATP synthase F1 subcomplex epsilon subunit [Austwickia chelonae]|uniref:ATP synthase epsilon chain n=1 Tax=Austwickia chelonae NBRC 105200 TaxID=1184607 RepID=K6W4G5_9MICO|nr:F0F1 ATP synthase subunit epsilon [Austwickia chelonae]GAB76697.1 ATP synthase subunit epsilon [Austwickia chelonae NBRC 105200]SEW29430.1 ATP synthase F1 subcomplex epsilon subunit [Austwickia chelonae]